MLNRLSIALEAIRQGYEVDITSESPIREKYGKSWFGFILYTYKLGVVQIFSAY